MSLNRVRRVLASTLFALGSLPLAAAPLLAQAGSVTGKVTDASTGQPLGDANVSAISAGSPAQTTRTSADGAYRLSGLPAGTYTVTVTKVGYQLRRMPNIDVSNGATVTLNTALSSTATMLEAQVVTATRSVPEKALDAPASISVIPSERIEERPAITVADHLRSTPGVDISRGGIAQANIVSRGFNNAFSGAMLMLQDYRFAGVPSLRVNVPFLFTGTNEDIDRMEVLLGPASALYGPNSSSGVLHIITKSPFAAQGTTISVDGGTQEVIRGGIRHSQKFSERLAMKLSGEYMRGNDFEYTDLAEATTFPTGASTPEARRGQPNVRDYGLERLSGEARMDIRPTASTEAITTFGFSRIGSGLELTSLNGTAQVKNWTYSSIQQRFRWNRLFAQAFMNMSDAGNKNALDTRGTYLLRSGQPIVDQSRVWALQAQHGFDLGLRQGFTYGIDYINTNPRTGGTINGSNEDIDDVQEWGAYVQSSTRPLNWFELLLAARVDGNNVIEDNTFSPRAALIFKPTENQNIRLTYNRAFSTPGNFSFFVDLINTPNIGNSGYDLVGRGNPPKTGWTYRRDCTGSAFDENVCMRSKYVQGGAYTAASAATVFPGLISTLSTPLTGAITPGITQALRAAGFSETQAAALAPTLAAGTIQHLAGLTPTNADLATRVSFLSAPTTGITPAQLPDIEPLEASYNTTYELGYKGIIGNRFRYDISYWGQERGDVATTGALATPNVFFGNPQQLGGYLGTNIAQYLVPALMQNAGLTQAQAGAIVQQLAPGLAGGLTPTLAQIPFGVVTFNAENTSPTAIYATYSKLDRKIWVRGLDLAMDIVATDRITFETAFSWQNQNIWRDIIVAGAPFASNSPMSRGSIGMRYRDEDRGIGFETRVKYSEAYPVNSSSYQTNAANIIAAGRPGAPTSPPTATGYNRCSPPPAGTFCYENVPESFLVDAQVSKRFDLGANRFTWSVSATNLFDNRVRTFPGVPEIGRMILTRLQYQF
jgi:outer membrane receptor for ferrienterochelin and colicins